MSPVSIESPDDPLRPAIAIVSGGVLLALMVRLGLLISLTVLSIGMGFAIVYLLYRLLVAVEYIAYES